MEVAGLDVVDQFRLGGEVVFAEVVRDRTRPDPGAVGAVVEGDVVVCGGEFVGVEAAGGEDYRGGFEVGQEAVSEVGTGVGG